MMRILRRLEKRAANWMLGDVSSRIDRVEAGLRVRLNDIENKYENLETCYVQLLNNHMDVSKDFEYSEALVAQIRIHADRLAHQYASDCERSDDCFGCQWADTCRVAEYYNNGDIHGNRR